MAHPPFDHPKSTEAAAREARRATAALLAKIAARRRRTRLLVRFGSRETAVDLVVAMATYTGITAALILGAIYGVSTVLDRLAG